MTIPFIISACDLGSFIGGESSVNNGNSPASSQSFNSKNIPVQEEEQIKKNIGSYSSKFSITTFDGTSNYDVKFDATLNAGIVTREGQDFYFVRGRDNYYVVYYENPYGFGYVEDYNMDLDFNLDLLYMNLIFDISAELQENAPYASKKDVTYAGRNATEYIIKNRGFIIPTDTDLTIVLDNETGAILSLLYDHINFYQSTSFMPNDEAASNAVKAKKDTLAFDFYDKEVLALVGLENLKLPNWYERSATYSLLDDSSKDVNNMANYSAQYYDILRDTKQIEDVAKFIYNSGIKYDYDGKQSTFEELYNSDRSTINFTVVDTLRLNAYTTIGGTKYNVVFQGVNRSTDPDLWSMTLAIHKIID